MKALWPWLLVAALAGCLFGCSPNRNTAATRKYQAFITRYNIYFNGDEHFKQTLKELESSYEDDYSRRLYMHPVEAKADEKAPQPSGNFDRSIEKAQKAIQVRSIKKKPKKQPGKSHDEKYKEWMKRSEYNPFMHNAWMMMGRSQYFNGDFSGAAATFLYVSRHFKWLPATVTEAKLWEARCYLADDWLYEAEVIITRVKPEQLTNKTLRRLYHFDWADFLVRSHRYEEAVPQLQELIKLSSGRSKMRLNFLLGQVLSELGRKSEAYQAFKAAGGSSAADYRTQFNARIRQSEVFEGDNITPEVNALRRMTRYDRNKEFLDQIYYAIGNLYISRQDTLQAIENYRKAVSLSTRNGYDKALANLALGNLYFAEGRYDLAQPCMSEAVPQLPADFPDLPLIKRRSDVLDELAVYAGNVHLQDSLLALSELSPEEQMDVCKRLAEEYKKKKKEEEEAARREEQRAEAQANGTPLPDSNVASQMNLGTDDSWYFYNSQAVASGKQAFQRQWGARKLEDNWRRRNKQEFSMSDFGSADNEDETEDAEGAEQGSEAEGAKEATEEEKKRQAAADNPEDPAYYFKDIPQTDVEKTNAADIIQEGLYNMGLILKDKLDDFPAAVTEFDKLMTRFPDNVYRLDVYNNLYLLYVRQGDMARAEHYRHLIVTEFADSPLGQAMAAPDYLENLKVMEQRQEEIYEQTLADYYADRNTEVRANYELMKQEFPMSKIMPKFMFLTALTYVTENKPELFTETLKEMLERYPDTDLTPPATAWLKGLASGRKLQSSGSNMRGMVWSTRLVASGDSLQANPDAPLVVELNPEKPQLLVLLYQLSDVNAAQLLYEVARFNFSTFVVRDFELEQMTFGPLGVLVIKGFANARELDHYRRRFESAQNVALMIPPGVRPVVISEENFDRLVREGRSFEEYFEAIGEKVDAETHESVLPASEFPPAKEFYEELETQIVDEGLTPEILEGEQQPDADFYDIPVPEAPKQPLPAPLRRPDDVPEGSEGED